MRKSKGLGLATMVGIGCLALAVSSCSSEPKEATAVQGVWNGYSMDQKVDLCAWSDTTKQSGAVTEQVIAFVKKLSVGSLVEGAQKTNPDLDKVKLNAAAFALLDRSCQLGQVTG
jgi:hypothetical protein